MADGREPNLQSQAIHAALTHEQASVRSHSRAAQTD